MVIFCYPGWLSRIDHRIRRLFRCQYRGRNCLSCKPQDLVFKALHRALHRFRRSCVPLPDRRREFRRPLSCLVVGYSRQRLSFRSKMAVSGVDDGGYRIRMDHLYCRILEQQSIAIDRPARCAGCDTGILLHSDHQNIAGKRRS